MRDWSVSLPDESGPAHATTSPWLPRWSSLAAAVAVPAVMVVAFAAPLHGSVRHQHTVAARPVAAATTAVPDEVVAVADTLTDPPAPTSIFATTAAAVAAAPTPSAAPASPAAISALAADGIPQTALDAYENAATRADAQYPSCKLPWPLLAGIGRVESDHGRYGGAVLYSDGTSSRRILGIPLDGSRSATITDTDHGALDGDRIYDRAVGPMQFIPSTWASYGVDGNGDGKADPFNIFDAALAAARYLCVAGGDLSTMAGQTRAVLAYNHSSAYLAEVTALERSYAAGAGVIVPVGPPPPVRKPTLPPVDPGPPLSGTHPSHPAASSSPAPVKPSSSSSHATPSSAPSKPAASCASPTGSPSSSPTTGGRLSALPGPSFPFPAPTDTADPNTSPAPSTSTSTDVPTPSPTRSC
jgi:membrane-bound lytic murein transglycosylase B